MSSSRGRGVSNTPAWMSRQQQHQQHQQHQQNQQNQHQQHQQQQHQHQHHQHQQHQQQQQQQQIPTSNPDLGPSPAKQEPHPKSRSRSRSRSPNSTHRDNGGSSDAYGRSSRETRERDRDRDRDRDRERDYGRSHRDWERGGRSRNDPMGGGPPSRYRDGHSSRDHRDFGSYPPHRDRNGPPYYRGGGPRGGGGGPRDSSSRSRGPPSRRRGNHKNEIQFQSIQEEREWIEERRRKRQSRKSLFDVPPTPEQLALEAAALVYQEHHQSQIKDRANMDGFSRKGISPSLSRQPQQTRHARRLYIGQLPLDVSESEVHAFFHDCIKVATNKDEQLDQKSEVYDDDDPILSVYINRERRFAFVEFRTMEICSACLALDGINILGKGKVKIKRPNDYNPAMAPEASSVIHFDVSRLGIVSGTVPDGPNKIFIGGLPYHLTEDQVMELLGAFGQVKAFHLVKADATALTSKGYCFVEYSDPNVTAVAVMGLNGMAMGGDKVLSARMAAARGTVLPGQGNVFSSPGTMQPSEIEQEQARARMAQQVGGGVDVEALLNMAMQGAVVPPAQPAVTSTPGNAASMITGTTSIDPAFSQNMANAALDAAFGGTNLASNPQSSIPTPTKILVLLNMVTNEDLATDEDYADLFDEVKEECTKFGNLVSMKIPRPKDGYELSAVKKIFLEYADPSDAEKSRKELAGRAFGPNVVEAVFFNEQDFYSGKLS